MTDGQVKYQTMIENQRHNLAMEKNQGKELDIAQQEADISARNATTREREVATKEAMLPYEQSLRTAQISEIGQRTANEKKDFWTGVADFFFGPIKREVEVGRQTISKLFF